MYLIQRARQLPLVEFELRLALDGDRDDNTQASQAAQGSAEQVLVLCPRTSLDLTLRGQQLQLDNLHIQRVNQQSLG